jgi:hypothetical protein
MQFKLGRVAPAQIHQLDRYLLLKMKDGRLKLVAKLSAHFDHRRMVFTPPASMASINRVYLNDQLGDCVIAGKYHAAGIWSSNDDTQGDRPTVVGTDQEVLSSYHTICGPGDDGCVITDVLDYFQHTGLIINGQRHKIDGYVAVDWTNKTQVQAAILLFGGFTIGMNLPQAWTSTNTTWDVPSGRASQVVGGHDVRVFDYNEIGPRAATWGGIVQFTWAAFRHKPAGGGWGIEEAYVELSPDWYGPDKLAKGGIDAVTLLSDLQIIGGGGTPDDPTPAPPPAPVPPTPPQPPVPPAPPAPPVPPQPPTPPTPPVPGPNIIHQIDDLFAKVEAQLKGHPFVIRMLKSLNAEIDGLLRPYLSMRGTGVTVPSWVKPAVDMAFSDACEILTLVGKGDVVPMLKTIQAMVDGVLDMLSAPSPAKFSWPNLVNVNVPQKGCGCQGG